MMQNRTEVVDKIPKLGKVNQVCEEWKVREDGALAYRLQNQEINEHYTGNKFRNALLREDFPRAKDEQLKEQKLAEEAAAIYQKMLAEQEKMDYYVAEQLAQKLDIEEKQKQKNVESYDEQVVKRLLKKSRPSPSKLCSHHSKSKENPSERIEHEIFVRNFSELRCDNHDSDEILTPDELDKLRQEEKDAELARKLQEEEASLGEFVDRDRLLAIEAQDKELAKLLQEKEKAKARKAREKHRQRVEQRNQQRKLENQNTAENDYLLPDDTYSYPVDVLPSYHNSSTPCSTYQRDSYYADPTSVNEEINNYSLPLDVLPNTSRSNSQDGAIAKDIARKSDAVRPTQLNLRYSHNETTKFENPVNPEELKTNSSPMKMNIAMAVDPTYKSDSPYNRCGLPSSTSTSSSSPGSSFMSYDVSSHPSDETIPPYMPIQGHKRMASLEKKQKKKNKDGGCKQQ